MTNLNLALLWLGVTLLYTFTAIMFDMAVRWFVTNSLLFSFWLR